jgi:hypothetical protein
MMRTRTKMRTRVMVSMTRTRVQRHIVFVPIEDPPMWHENQHEDERVVVMGWLQQMTMRKRMTRSKTMRRLKLMMLRRR